MNLASLLQRAARTHPSFPALIRGTELHADYATLARRVAALAGWLRAQPGLAAGARVGIVMTNRVEFMEVLLGTWWAGLVAVPVNAKLHAAEAVWVLDNAGARIAFLSPDLAEDVARAAKEGSVSRFVTVGTPDYDTATSGEGLAEPALAAPGDLAWLFYTSGTTGRPKGAMLSHRSLLNAALSYYADVESVSAEDRLLHAAPMSHGSGIYSVPFLAMGAAQIVPESGRFEPEEIVELLAHHARVSFFAAPTMVRRLIDHPGLAGAKAANLKTIVYGGGPMYLDDAKRACRLLPGKLVQIYGQGESPMTITCLPREDHAGEGGRDWERKLASVGRAHTVCEVAVLDEEDQPLPAGEVGEVAVRGDVLMSGYWNNEEATRETLRNGWLHTGDVGSMDADGYLTLRDRSKDVIISGGTNIYPREVEEVLLTHEDVLEVSVIGLKDAEWGEVVAAYVRAAEGADPAALAQALDRLCLSRLARFKRPKGYGFVRELPKNNYGKVLKTELRAQADPAKLVSPG